MILKLLTFVLNRCDLSLGFPFQFLVAQRYPYFLDDQPARQESDGPEAKIKIYATDVSEDGYTVQSVLEIQSVEEL
jgi:hypothetical protein